MTNTTAGFAANLDVDLSLSTSDRGVCLYNGCSCEPVMLGIISTPCGCPQPLCLVHFEQEKPKWWYGDSIACHFCRPVTSDKIGKFLRWERA